MMNRITLRVKGPPGARIDSEKGEDGGVQIGVSSNAPAFAAFGGVSIIVGDILGNHGAHARQRQQQRRAAARPRR